MNEVTKDVGNDSFLGPEEPVTNKQETTEVQTKNVMPKPVAPKRTMPKLIQELLDNDIPVLLIKEGYLVPGFYGATYDGQEGVVLGKDSSGSEMIFYDHKKKAHLIKTFNDLVVLNNHVWSAYHKGGFTRPDPLWFAHLLNSGVLNISPGR